MYNLSTESIDKPFLSCKDDIVNEVNESFIDLIGYPEIELIGKSLADLSRMIRIDSQIDLKYLVEENNFYIFSKSLSVIDVSISCKFTENPNEKILSFTRNFTNTHFQQLFDYTRKLFPDSKTGVAIHSLPDLILLKADQKYIDLLQGPNNTIDNNIGYHNKEVYGSKHFAEIYENTISKGEPYYFEEVEAKHINGGIIYYNASLVPVTMMGKLKYLVQSYLDVTEKVINRKALELKVKELEAIFENISDDLIVFGKNGENIRMNKSARTNHSFDFSDSESFKRAFSESKFYDITGGLLLFDDLPFNRVNRGEKLSNYRMIIDNDKGVRYRDISGTPIYDNDGNFKVGVIVSHDITDRLMNEKSNILKTQYDLLSRLIENLELGLIRLSYPELNIIDFNQKANFELCQINLVDKSFTSIMGMNLLDLNILSKDDNTYQALLHSLEKKEQSITFVRKHIMSSVEKHFRTIFQPLYGLNDEIVEIIAIGIDITIDITAKNKMEETLKMQDELFVNMSHELKTPLNVIFSASQLMDIYIDNNSMEAFKDIIKSNNKIIKQNCYRLIKLISNIIDYSKIESGYLKLNLKNQNIVETMENVIQSISAYVKRRDLSIFLEIDIEEEIIAIDNEKIERVILNIVSNAIKFSDPGGEICIYLTEKDDFIQISIKDNGIGIEEKYLSSLFERFQQVDKTLHRNTEGSGLGLSLVKSIIDMHGGKISVESEVSKGSIFTIELPKKLVNSSKKIVAERSEGKIIEMMNIEFSDIY